MTSGQGRRMGDRWRRRKEQRGGIRVGGFWGTFLSVMGPSWHLVLFSEGDSICDVLQGKSETDQYVDTVRVKDLPFTEIP